MADGEVKFANLVADEAGLRFGKVRMIKQSDIGKCPHVIFVPDHYREDGTCKCNDPNEKVMAEWGYVWSDKTKQWEGSDD